MSPYEIRVLLHCYAIVEELPDINAKITQDTIKQFIGDKLIYIDENNLYRTTAKGEAHVAQLCSLPLPRWVFVNKNDEIILEVEQ